MKIAVTGSRSITSKDWVNYHLDKITQGYVDMGVPVTIISGGAKGVDSIANDWAYARKCDFVLFKPYHLVDNREEFRPKFFFVRNKQIVDNADEVVCFWDGVSSGTASTIELAEKAGKHLTVIKWDEREARAIEDLNAPDGS